MPDFSALIRLTMASHRCRACATVALTGLSMPLPTTDFFESTLRPAYEALRRTTAAAEHLNGLFRFDGIDISVGDNITLFGTCLPSREVAQLLMAFDGSRVHGQDAYRYGDDDAPPGTYFTTVHKRLIHEGHKNRVGIYDDVFGASLFLAGHLTESRLVREEAVTADVDSPLALHVDHFYLSEQAPAHLGTVAFALCAMTAHCLGYQRVSLVAGGGRGYDQRMIGYLFWPKLGFDAPLEVEEKNNPLYPPGCHSVQDILDVNPTWWAEHGCQRWMDFNLAADSVAWRKLLNYLQNRGLL